MPEIVCCNRSVVYQLFVATLFILSYQIWLPYGKKYILTISVKLSLDLKLEKSLVRRGLLVSLFGSGLDDCLSAHNSINLSLT